MGPRLGTPDRRHAVRGFPTGEPSRFDLVHRILGSYWEMAGLTLTLAEAAQLFGASQRACELVLSDLVAKRVLHRSENGTYTKAAQ
jgi:hypothetical protein